MGGTRLRSGPERKAIAVDAENTPRGERPADRRSRIKLDWKRALGVDRFRMPGGPSRSERLLLRRLRKQEFSRGRVAIERIPGGISNHNFAVRAGGVAYFARLCQERPLLGIDRRTSSLAIRRPAAWESHPT